jgi:hypothetical protein
LRRCPPSYPWSPIGGETDNPIPTATKNDRWKVSLIGALRLLRGLGRPPVWRGISSGWETRVRQAAGWWLRWSNHCTKRDVLQRRRTHIASHSCDGNITACRTITIRLLRRRHGRYNRYSHHPPGCTAVVTQWWWGKMSFLWRGEAGTNLANPDDPISVYPDDAAKMRDFARFGALVAYVAAAPWPGVLPEPRPNGPKSIQTTTRCKEALTRAKSGLAIAVHCAPLVPGEPQREDGGGLRWRVRVTPITSTAVRPCAARRPESVLRVSLLSASRSRGQIIEPRLARRKSCGWPRIMSPR